MVKLILFLAVLLCFEAPEGAARENYTLQDLEILVTDSSYDEFFAHALDVRPLERQEVWKGMVAKMAEGLARKIMESPEVSTKNFKRIEGLFQWPSLHSSDVFKNKRQEIGLTYLRKCLRAQTPCWAEFKTFWEADPSDAEVAYRLSEMTLNRSDSPVTTWALLEVAVKSPLSEFYCKKDFVLDAIWGKLEMDYIRMTPQGDFLKRIDETVHHDCIPALNKMAQTRLYSSARSGQQRELAYQILAAQGKSNEEMRDFFYSVYLLENPSQGDLFNLSWNRLTLLARQPARRERVLAKLKSLDPLPDELFSSLDVVKKRAVLNHFKTSFPEYLFHYADQCISYYGGKGKHENGNPTMHCPDFMNSELAVPSLGVEKVQQYQQVRKI